MAPEQAKTPKVDGRADVYSVGAMAYEMLSGRMPYQMDPGEPVWALLARKMFDPPPELAEIEPKLPKELAQLVMTLLAREPAERPTMAQLDSVLCRLRGIDPKKRSGIHATVAAAEPIDPSGRVTLDAPVAVPLTPHRSPTVDELPGAPPPHLLSPPRPVSPTALGYGDGAVAEEMPSVSTAPIAAKAQVPAAVPPAHVAASPTPTASSPPARPTAWLLGIMAVVMASVIALVAYLAPGRSDNRPRGQQGRLTTVHDLAASTDLAALTDLTHPADLGLPAASVRSTDAKPKDQPHLRASHGAHCATVTVTAACLHGKNLGQELRRRILAALGDPDSKLLRLCAGERLVVRIGDSGVRLVDAPERLPAKVQKDFELILDGHLDGISHSGEIEILCSAPVR